VFYADINSRRFVIIAPLLTPQVTILSVIWVWLTDTNYGLLAGFLGIEAAKMYVI